MRIVDLRDIKDGFDSSAIERIIASEETNDTQNTVDSLVAQILADVRQRGDAAVCEYSKRFDNFELPPSAMRLTIDEISQHAAAAKPEMVEVLRAAIKNVREFHLHQADESWEFYAGEGVRLGVRNTAIESVGLYIPGG
jgi:histidinol dehydrogenase